MFKNILIIGFGMIGTSIARSIPKSTKQANIYAFDKSKDFSKRLRTSGKVQLFLMLLIINAPNKYQEKSKNQYTDCF